MYSHTFRLRSQKFLRVDVAFLPLNPLFVLVLGPSTSQTS